MRMRAPRRSEVGAKSKESQQPRGRYLIEDEGENLQSRGVGPVEVFPGTVHGSFLGFLDDPGHQRFLGLLLLFLRAQRKGWSTLWLRQWEQGGQQWQGIGLREAVLGEDLLEFGQLGLQSLVRRKLQEPLQVLDDRIEG